MANANNERRPGRPRSNDPRVVVSAGIKSTERDELQAIADSYGLALGAVVTYFVRHSLELHRAKKMKIPTVTKTIVRSLTTSDSRKGDSSG